MKLLITGGAGFIGSNFVRYILNKYPEDEVINLDLLTYAGNLENLKDVEKNPNYKFAKGDIADKKLVNELVKDVDIIVNFAAESHVDRSILDSSDFIRTVEDHCEAIDLIVRQGCIGETYCIGGNCEKPNIEIARKILELLKASEEMIEYVKDRPGHDRRYAMDFSKIKSKLGWQPRTSFEEGMQKTVEWYKANIDWWRDIKMEEYLEYYKKQYGR